MNARRKAIIVLIIQIFTAYSGISQNADSSPVQKSIAVKKGLYNMASIDNLYSPFLYSGKSYLLGFGWGKEERKRSFETDFSFSNIQRKPLSLQELPASYENGHHHLVKNSFIFEVMDYYRFLISKADHNNLQIFFSGLWFTTLNITTNANGVPELFQSGIAPGIQVRRKAGTHSFKAELHLPLAAWTVRNSYSISSAQIYEKKSKLDFIRQNSMLQTPISNPGLFGTLGYEWCFNPRLSLKANYSFRYLQSKKPQMLKTVSGIYSLALIYNR